MKDIPEGVRIVTLERRGTDRDAKVPLKIPLLTLRADSAGFFDLARPVLLVRKTYPELHYLPDLVQKLRTSRPRVIISALPELNVLALWASRHVRPRPRVVVTEHSVHTPLPRSKRHGRWFKRFLPQVMYRTYGLADAIVAVSDGVGDDVAAFTGLPRERIQTIYNPVVPDDVEQLAAEPVSHPWFLAGGPPVVLGAGRLHQQKDFPTRAFARVRKERPVRLVIFGESEHGDTDSQREALMKVAGELGVAEEVSLPGCTANLFAYMASAAVFVLSSRWEGSPTVLIEAMACGCPVVSTDCPSGPREILEGGIRGELAPIGDDAALAQASSMLDFPRDRGTLMKRAGAFSVDAAVRRYDEVLFVHPCIYGRAT